MQDDTLKLGEAHPAAYSALEWFNKWKLSEPISYITMREAVASSALSGNRLAEIMNGTLNRLESGDTVSDRYVLGLVWILKESYGNITGKN